MESSLRFSYLFVWEGVWILKTLNYWLPYLQPTYYQCFYALEVLESHFLKCMSTYIALKLNFILLYINLIEIFIIDRCLYIIVLMFSIFLHENLLQANHASEVYQKGASWRQWPWMPMIMISFDLPNLFFAYEESLHII